MAAGNLAVDPVMQLATIGVLGVGAQSIAWGLRVPAIVLMLGIGLLAGPLLGVLDPKAALGDLMTPIISIAVAVILFEGGLTLNFHQLRDASQGVTRFVLVGAPLGWITSAHALHYVAGVSWAVAAVFGGIMIVTGPTVIAPLLLQAKLSHRPAALLQWEAIVNDPIGALAAVLAYEVIVVSVAASTVGEAAVQLIIGLIVSSAAGVAGGYGIAQAFRRGWVPEYMKVPVLHGFTLTPVARALGLSGGDAPGVLIVGGTSLGTQLGALLRDLDVPVVISDTNHRNLRSARDLGVPVF